MEFTLYVADCKGKQKNTLYPNKCIITNIADFCSAIAFDHVCADFKNHYRGNDNFISADCLVMDNDNDRSDNPNDWIYPEDYENIFPNTAYVVAPSKNNMKVKGNKSARPRHHIYFPHKLIIDVRAYIGLKKAILKDYPFFDVQAADAARFMYGNDTKDIIWHEGPTDIDFLFSQEAEIPQGSRNSTMSHFAGKVLKRYGETDKAYEIFIEKSEKCSPPLSDEELKTIWQSALKFFRKIAKSPDYISADKYESNVEESNPIHWDEPIPLEGEILPSFPVDALPKVLKDYVASVAESTQTSIDMAAAGVLAVISACMRNLYKVEGKSDWWEPTNIYVLIVAEPSERKTAVISLLKKPIDEFVGEYNKEHKVEFEMSKAVKQRLENTKNRLISATKKKGAPDTPAEDFNDKLQEVIEQLVNFKEQKPMRIYVDDTTPEKLVEILSENNNAISIISSEGGIFDVLSGTYSSKVNIDVFLKAYSGERITVDRIMRDSVIIDDACLTILLTVQPVVISDFMSNKKFRHRGLTARFLYTNPKSQVGERSFYSLPIDPNLYEHYKNVIYNILSENRSSTPNLIKLTDEAKSVLTVFYDWVEERLAGEFSVYGDWIGKLVGNTLRLAGILARASIIKKDVGEAFLESDRPVEIDKHIMENAVEIGKYFFLHAVSSYSAMGVHSEFKSALKALEKIRSNKEEKITRRGLMRICRWISGAEEAQSILDTLEDCGYVRIVTVENADRARGGRPKNAVYAVNPSLFK